MRATSHSTYRETLVVGPRLKFMQQERRTPSYRVFGSGTDPVVVVPGGPLLDGTYLGDLGGLSARRALAVPELPRVRVSQVAGLIEAVRKDIDLETVDVVAHSAGAPAALFYLARYPQRIRRLVLVTPAVSSVGINPDPEGIAAVLHSRKDEPGIAAAIAASDADPGSLEAQRLSFGAWGNVQEQLARDSLVDRAARLSTYYAEPRPDPAALQTAAKSFDRPVTVVRGEVDVHPTRRQAEALADLFPAAGVVALPDAGHYPWLDCPQLFIETVLTGLGSNST